MDADDVVAILIIIILIPVLLAYLLLLVVGAAYATALIVALLFNPSVNVFQLSVGEVFAMALQNLYLYILIGITMFITLIGKSKRD